MRKTGANTWKSVTTAGNTAVIKKMKRGGLYQFRAAAIGSDKKAGKYSNIKYRFFRGMWKVRFKAHKASIKATWKRSRGASGYQILISENKDLKRARVIMVKGKYKRSYTINDLESGKRYYISARPYKIKGGKRYTGIRSSIKSLTVK